MIMLFLLYVNFVFNEITRKGIGREKSAPMLLALCGPTTQSVAQMAQAERITSQRKKYAKF